MGNILAFIKMIPQILGLLRSVLGFIRQIKEAQEQKKLEEVKKSLDEIKNPEITKEEQVEKTRHIARGSF